MRRHYRPLASANVRENREVTHAISEVVPRPNHRVRLASEGKEGPGREGLGELERERDKGQLEGSC
eukprot:74134-Rhodomonas_salina.1